ncbi:MAG: hypothetical protein JSS36_08245 [Proteobacteria bacterium]|nr:hypothetical protein [Pseudomonadota bacterium]
MTNGSGSKRTGSRGGGDRPIPPQVIVAIAHLVGALKALDQIEEFLAAAHVATALDRLKADWGIDT